MTKRKAESYLGGHTVIGPSSRGWFSKEKKRNRRPQASRWVEDSTMVLVWDCNNQTKIGEFPWSEVVAANHISEAEAETYRVRLIDYGQAYVGGDAAPLFLLEVV